MRRLDELRRHPLKLTPRMRKEHAKRLARCRKLGVDERWCMRRDHLTKLTRHILGLREQVEMGKEKKLVDLEYHTRLLLQLDGEVPEMWWYAMWGRGALPIPEELL